MEFKAENCMDNPLYPIFFMKNVNFGLESKFLGEKKCLKWDFDVEKKSPFCNDISITIRDSDLKFSEMLYNAIIWHLS